MRNYDGCLDTELKTYLENITKAEAKLKEWNSKAHCTYFPMEQRFQVWLDNKPIGKWSTTRVEAIDSAINNSHG